MLAQDLDLAELAAGIDQALYESGWCQRSTERQQTWRHISEGGFNSADYTVKEIGEQVAKTFIVQHHYLGSWCGRRFRYGMFEGDELVGVAVLGDPMHPAVLTNPFPTLVPSEQSLAVNRLCLLDRVGSNGESWFMTEVIGRAGEKGIRGLVMYSDGQPRLRVSDGQQIMPGHVGIVYQALNALYLRRGRSSFLTVADDGNLQLSRRSMNKALNGEQGGRGVQARIDAATTGLSRVKANGKHRFAIRCGTRDVRRRTPIACPDEQGRWRDADGKPFLLASDERLPYPKQPDTNPLFL